MWICAYCETENLDESITCVCCGHEKAVKVHEPVTNISTKEKKKQRPSTIIVVVATVIFLFSGFFLFHIWNPATCTQPETCALCGKERAPALGHKWKSATCTEPQKCSVCGAVGSPALGHNWRDATYDEPKTCMRCGLKSGEVKGYIGYVSGSWNEEKIYVRGNQESHAYELSQVVDNCIRMTMDITVTDYSGYPFGDWYLYARSKSGKWSHIGLFEINQEMINHSTTISFSFDSPTSISALTIVQRGSNQYSINYSVRYYGFQQYVD